MRFGMMAAAAAALVASSQADAARYYEFELKGAAYFPAQPGVGDNLHSYIYDLTYRFVFDTMTAASSYVATDGYDNVFLNPADGAGAFVYDLANGETGPEFSFGFNLANVANSATLQNLAVSGSFFKYVIRVDPRYSTTVSSQSGTITSLKARTSDVAPSFTGLVGGATATAVPEPAAWAMMISGAALIGAVARRRKKPQAVAA